jgi:hypothetical protein
LGQVPQTGSSSQPSSTRTPGADVRTPRVRLAARAGLAPSLRVGPGLQSHFHAPALLGLYDWWTPPPTLSSSSLLCTARNGRRDSSGIDQLTPTSRTPRPHPCPYQRPWDPSAPSRPLETLPSLRTREREWVR